MSRAIAVTCNEDQSNLAKGGIVVANLPNSSFVFTRWQQQFAIAYSGCWFEISPFSEVGFHLTQVVIGPHECSCQMASKSKWFLWSARIWQTTDHATEKCVAVGGIAWSAREIPPKICNYIVSNRKKKCWVRLGLETWNDESRQKLANIVR